MARFVNSRAMVIALDNECVVWPEHARRPTAIEAGVDEDLYDHAAPVADLARLQARRERVRRRVSRSGSVADHTALPRRRGLLGTAAPNSSAPSC